MNTKRKTAPSPEGQRQLETLRQAVAKILEKKRCLGQYSVVWRDGKSVVSGEDAPDYPANTSS
jgi:DNA-binding PadR family transcriptional regulator